jgi:hypothetical protein
MPTSGSGRLRESANGSQESRRLGWRVCLANSLGLTQGLLSKRLLTKTAVSLCQTFAFVSESCSSGGAASEDASRCPLTGNAAQCMQARMLPFAEVLAKLPNMPCFPPGALATARDAPVDLLGHAAICSGRNCAMRRLRHSCVAVAYPRARSCFSAYKLCVRRL